MRTRLLFVPLFISPLLFSQNISFGIAGGANITDSFGTVAFPLQIPQANGFEVYSTGPRSFIVGPSIEWKLPWGFALEVDALHRSLQSNQQFISSTPGFPSSKVTTRSTAPWEIPLLAKYRFWSRGIRPFIEGGASFRPAGSAGVSHFGITAGGGIGFHVSDFEIAPTLRYMRWNSQFSVPPERQNQLEALVGFAWMPEREKRVAFGHRISFGVLAGATLGDGFRPVTSDIFVQHPDSNTIIVGPSVEVAIARSFSVEVDGLYRPFHGTNIPSTTAPDNHVNRFATLTWEFPVLVKYRFSTGRARPFVELGPAFRASGNIEVNPPGKYGVTAGAGVEFGMRRWKLAPTLRYSHWSPDQTTNIDGGHAFRNEAALLLGLSF